MENKKIIVAIIVVIILIILLITISYSYNKFNTNQMNILTEETNKILQRNLADDEIDMNIKSEKNYAIVEKNIKEYLSKMQNIYVEVENITNINPNNIFSAENIEDKNLEEIDTIINELKEKSEKSMEEYKDLIKEENIIKNIEEQNITTRKDYFVDLYKTVMLSEVMKTQYENIGNKIEDKKDELTDKLEQVKKIKEYLEENSKYWSIKNEKIEFKNITIMTQYYNLLNRMVD